MLLPQLHRRSLLALTIAIAAGYAGNYFSLPLFFGVDFIFGSIAVLLVVRFFGTGWGVLAAAIASTHTVVLWNHPYAIIIYICEALFVGLLWQRQRQNFVLIDITYWLCFGIPLVWLIYFKCLQVDTTLAWLVILRYSVNGIFNVLVASLLATYLPLHEWVSRPQFGSKPALRQIFIALLLPAVFLPALLPILLDCRLALVHIENEIQTELHTTSNNLISNLHNRYQEYLKAISQLGQVAAAADMTPSSRLLQSMELMHDIYPDLLTIRAIDTTGKVVAAYPPPQQDSSLAVDERSQLQATKTNLEPAIGNVHIHPYLNIPHADLSVPVFADARFVGSMYVELNFDSINEFLRSQLPPKVQHITLLDAENKTVFSTDPQQRLLQAFDRVKGGEIQLLDRDLYLWLPPQSKLPTMVRWQQSFYVEEISLRDIPEWKLILAIPANSYIKFLYYAYINDFAFMLVAAVLAIICGMLLSHHLTKPLSQLTQVTTNLPHKLLEREKVVWPSSLVIEINSLINNFKLMAIALNEKFYQVQATNQTLKQRVKERTKELAKSNKELANKINENQQTDAALRDSEERYRDLFENANDLIHSVTHNGDFVYVNRAWQETLGYTEAEICGMKLFDIIHPEQIAQIRERFQRVIAGEKIEQLETAFITKDGKKIWIEGSVNCQFVNGKPIATRGIFRNITERKQAEAEISYALEKERQLIELKSRFITTASHEFRTPLTVILMSAKLLEQFSNQASEEKKRLYLDRIQTATKRMTQLLDDVLLIGKAEAGKLDFNPAPLQLEKFCREIVEEMQFSSNDRHSIDLEYHEQNTLVEADEKLLRYILSNLLSNAIKYSPKGGTITFRLTVNQEQAIFEIQDRGIGIPAADREQLFKSFSRGSNVENISGTGLGMSIVKQCIDLHGGEITVNSEVEVGTTFTVTLPLKQCVESL